MKKAKTEEKVDRRPDGPAESEAPAPGEEAPTAEGGATATAAEEPPATEAAPSADDVARDLAEVRERHMRLAAEFDNYRKRVERERAESWNRAQAQLVERLLDVVDDLQRVAHFNPETATAEQLLEGTQLVERKFLRALEGAGLEPVEAEGERFDPNVHEALTTVPAESAEEDDQVADVFQKGYRFKGQLLRPARVRVKRYEG